MLIQILLFSQHYIYWLIDVMLVRRCGLVKGNAQLSHHYSVNLNSSFLLYIVILSAFRENSNMVINAFPFYIFMLLANLWYIRHEGLFPIRRTRSSPNRNPIIRPLRGDLGILIYFNCRSPSKHVLIKRKTDEFMSNCIVWRINQKAMCNFIARKYFII